MRESKGKKNRKRWRVSSWSGVPTSEEDAKRLEESLNSMSECGYDVRDVDFDNKLIIGYLPDELVVERGEQEEAPPPTTRQFDPGPVPQVPAGLQALMERIGAKMVNIGSNTQRQMQSEDDDSLLQAIKGAQSKEYLCALQRLAEMGPDKVTAARLLDSAVSGIFKDVSREEIVNSISDVEYCFERHKKVNNCTTCALQETLRMGIERLQAKLAVTHLH